MIQPFLMVLFLSLGFSDKYPSNVKKTSNTSIFFEKTRTEIKLDQYLNSNNFGFFASYMGRYNSIVKLSKIGDSAVKDNPIWAFQISRNVREKRKLLKPMFKFVANINGDETVGYGLMVSLIKYLVYSDGVDERITAMLNTTDIWIIPTLNPDRLFSLEKNKNTILLPPKNALNELNIELDQDFPDRFFEETWPYQKETESMMNFIEKNPFVLSGNFQGGEIVASYPFDNADSTKEQGAVSLTSDNDIFEKLAKDYAQRNKMMAPGNGCDKSFPHGIANGNSWNKKRGSMQDANYLLSNCFEITLHLSCDKWVPPSDLPLYWDANLPSMLHFIESIHQGIFGLVKDKEGKPIKGASVEVKGRHKSIKTSEDGEYWRLLVPGSYEVTVRAPPTFIEKTKQVDLTKEPHVKLDFVLARQSVSGTVVNDDNRKPVVEGIIKAVSLEEKQDVEDEIKVQDGKFGMMLSPGKYLIMASAPGCRGKNMPVSVTEQEPVQLHSLLIRQGIFGLVRDLIGPIPEAVIEVRTKNKTTDGDDSLVTKVPVDENGEYWVRLNDGNYSINALAPGGLKQKVQLQLNETQRSVGRYFHFSSELTEFGYRRRFRGVYGYITNYKGKVVKGTVVRIKREGEEDIVVKINGKGEYERSLFEGKYQIMASAPGYKTLVKKVHIKSHIDTELIFHLRPNICPSINSLSKIFH